MAIFDLILKGPLHQGEFTGINREDSLDWIPSDTLFSAIVATWAKLGEPISESLEGFVHGDPPFILTSAFPRAGAVRFYPAPARFPDHLLGGGLSHKSLKRLRWLSQGVLDALIRGDQPAAEEHLFLHQRSVWMTASEREMVDPLLGFNAAGYPYLWQFQIVPHATVDRLRQATNLFHTGRVVFGRDCGLWFGVRGITETIRQALAVLSDSGLGGMRSTGHGAFSFSEVKYDWPNVTSGWGYSLSRYAPQTEEEIRAALQSENSLYRFVTVGGWFQDDEGHAWRRRSVRMIAEGALLPATVKGGLVETQPLLLEGWKGPQRPIYRSGLPFLIPPGQFVEAQ